MKLIVLGTLFDSDTDRKTIVTTISNEVEKVSLRTKGIIMLKRLYTWKRVADSVANSSLWTQTV